MSIGYWALVDELITSGRERSPRGMTTREIPGCTFELTDPTRSHPVGIGRKYSQAIAAAEALCLIGGVANPALMLSVGSNFARFLDGGALHGAYGPRVRGQLPQAVEKLRRDRDSRQALVQVWDPLYDLAGWTPKDLPCTLTLAFSVHDNRLEMETVMRSNDVWWGTAHDVPMFTALQLTVASSLGLEPGTYRHHALSLHIYERDIEAAQELSLPSPACPAPPKRGGGVFSEGGIEQGMERARKILAGEDIPMPTPQESWYQDVLRPHLDKVERAKEGLLG
jgi:thymidylate synthase